MEVAGARASGSLALLSDAGHMAGDAAALALSLFARWLAFKPPTPSRTFGLRRSEVLAALANSLGLVALTGMIWREAWERLANPPTVDYRPVLAIAVAGLAANLVGASFLKGELHDLNVRGAFLHLLGDALGSAGVIASAAVIALTGWQAADPLVSFGIGALIAYGAWGLMRQALNVLLEAAPPHLSYSQIQQAILEVPGVAEVHDLHIWTITSGFEALSCHVVAAENVRFPELLSEVSRLLRERFGIEHTTIQIEAPGPGACQGAGCGVHEPPKHKES